MGILGYIFAWLFLSSFFITAGACDVVVLCGVWAPTRHASGWRSAAHWVRSVVSINIKGRRGSGLGCVGHEHVGLLRFRARGVFCCFRNRCTVAAAFPRLTQCSATVPRVSRQSRPAVGRQKAHRKSRVAPIVSLLFSAHFHRRDAWVSDATTAHFAAFITQTVLGICRTARHPKQRGRNNTHGAAKRAFPLTSPFRSAASNGFWTFWTLVTVSWFICLVVNALFNDYW